MSKQQNINYYFQQIDNKTILFIPSYTWKQRDSFNKYHFVFKKYVLKGLSSEI
jgi:hypothetical protein